MRSVLDALVQNVALLLVLLIRSFPKRFLEAEMWSLVGVQAIAAEKKDINAEWNVGQERDIGKEKEGCSNNLRKSKSVVLIVPKDIAART
jgi:hypothetical protein